METGSCLSPVSVLVSNNPGCGPTFSIYMYVFPFLGAPTEAFVFTAPEHAMPNRLDPQIEYHKLHASIVLLAHEY